MGSRTPASVELEFPPSLYYALLNGYIHWLIQRDCVTVCGKTTTCVYLLLIIESNHVVGTVGTIVVGPFLPITTASDQHRPL
jgi:hypothetical protein